MLITRSPFRISFFGGSTDYESFYRKNGSFIIGTSIDKYHYMYMRFRPTILPKKHLLVYSNMESVKNNKEIKNPLIQATFKYKKIDRPVEFVSFSDIPSRTGLGGSSAYCVGLVHVINKLYNKNSCKRQECLDAIHIERNLLNESGGIQDQIWASYGGFNSIEIKQDGSFFVKPIPITNDFKTHFEKSITLLYTNHSRKNNNFAKFHENKDKTNILNIAHEAYSYFLKEDIKTIGKLLYCSWEEKLKFSNSISTKKTNNIINEVIKCGAYGAKLLGAGGGGFVLVLSDPTTKIKIENIFRNSVLNIKFDTRGVIDVSDVVS